MDNNWGEGVGEVVHRKCGTCRHFEEGGTAASGRCLHPLRRDLEQMVLVRKNELACRNGWDEDLWESREPEPSTHASAAQTSSSSMLTDDGDGEWPEPIDRVASITILPSRTVQQRSDNASTSATDQPGGVPDEPSEDPVIEQRSAIQVAKRRRQEALARERAQIQAVAPLLDEESREKPVASRSNATPGASAKQSLPEPASANGKAALRSVTMVPLDEYTQPARRQAVLLPPNQAGHAPDNRSAQPIIHLQPETEEAATGPSPRPGTGTWATARNGQQWADPSTEPGGSHAIPRRSPSPEPNIPRQPEIQEPEPAVSEQPAIDVHPPDRPLPEQLSCLVPRCGTCRDFRPADGGERGWCNNHFAFDHRRMVQPDELACASTIGVWWVANDDWWLQRADISHHGCPTPAVDEHLGRTLANQTQARNGTASESNGHFGRASMGQQKSRGR
jgi:hypothetical protein